MNVETIAMIYEEDRSAVPAWADEVVILDRSVLDLKSFDHERKLPLITDILRPEDSGTAQADIVIYTNIDIALMPFFYEFVASKFRSGIDGMVINRRSIFPENATADELTTLYAEIGESHPGRDCFVFTPSALNEFDLGLVSIGAGDVGRVLLWNIALQARNFEWLDMQHLTFHIGDDRSWDRFEMAPYHDHNNDEARNVFARLEKEHGVLHTREPWSKLLPRPQGFWADERWAKEPRHSWIRAQRRLRLRWRRARKTKGRW